MSRTRRYPDQECGIRIRNSLSLFIQCLFDPFSGPRTLPAVLQREQPDEFTSSSATIDVVSPAKAFDELLHEISGEDPGQVGDKNGGFGTMCEFGSCRKEPRQQFADAVVVNARSPCEA